MATKSEIARLKVSVDVDVNKASLAELQKSLKDIQNSAKKADFQEELTSGLKQAAVEAQKVSDILTKSWNTKLNQMDLTKLNKNIKESYGSVDNLKKAMMQGGEVGAAAYNKIAQSVLTTNVQLKQSNILLDKMAITMSNTVRFGISSAVFNKMTDSISEAYSYIKRLDSSLNNIRIVSNASADEMERFAVQANKAAKSLGTSTLDYTNASLIYYQQGITEFKEIQERTDATLKLANTTGETASSVSDYMTAIWNNFDDGSKSLEYYADVLAKLGAETASSSDEIAAGLEKFASVSETVGLSYEYATSALTTITAATRQSADVVGTALKTLFSRIQDLELGDTLDDGTTLGTYSEALEKVGINIKTQSGDLKNMDDILDEMGAKWSTLSKDQQVALAQAVAGVRQYNQLMALMNNWSDMELNIERAKDATGTLNQQQAIYAESMEAHLQRLSTEAEKTYSLLFDEDALKSFANLATKLLATLNSYITGLGGGLNALGTIAFKTMGIFSNQIGGLVQQRLENQRAQETNESNEQVKQEFANELGAGSDKGLVANEEALNKQIEYYNQIKVLKGSLNEEDVQELNNSLSKIGQLKERVTFLENYKDIAKDINKGDFSKEGLSKSISDQRKEINKFIDKINEAKKAAEEYNATMETEGNMWLTEDQKKETKEYFKQFAEYQKGDSKAEKEAKDVIDNIIDGAKDLSSKDLDKLLKGYNQELETSRNKLYQLQGIYQACVDTENGMNVQLNTQLAQEEAIIEKKIQQKKEQQEIAAATRGLSLVLSTITSISGISDTIKNEDLDSWEKFKSIASVVLVQGISIAKNWKDIGALFSTGSKIATNSIAKLAVQLGVVESSAAAAEMSAGAMWTAMLGPIALIVAGIAAVGVGIYALVKAYNADADAAKEAAEQATKTAEIASQATQEYENLANAFEKYDQGIKQLKELTIGTEEYTNALKSANEAAMELIEADNSLAKYATKKNGIITFEKEDGTEFTQNELLTTSEARMNSAKAASSLAQANANRAQQKSDYTNFLRDVDLDVNEQALKNAIATTAVSIGTLGLGAKAALDVGTQSMQNTLSTDDLGVIIDQLIADGGEEVFALGKVEESLNKLSGLTDEEKRTLLEHTDKLKDLTTATIDLNATNKLLLQQSLESSLENDKDYAGLTDEQKAAVSARYGEGLTEEVEEKLRKEAEKEWNKDAWFGLGNEDEVHQAYAKARGWTLSQDKIGDKAVYLDKEGNAQTIEDDDARAYLINQEVQNNLKDYDKNNLDNIIKATKNINTKDFDSKYGANLEAGILSTISSGGKLDTDALFTGISPSEITKLENFSGEDWKEALGLTDEEMETLGLGSGQTFAENFKKAAEENYKWDAEAAVKNAMNTMDTSPKELGLDEEEFSSYTKHLMDMANETNNLADSMTEEAEAAVVVTRGIMRMNQGIDKLAEGQEEWIDILKKSSRTSQEYYDALTDMQDALADILDTEKDYISETFVRDHLKDIQKAADGDAAAIDRLHKALATDMIAHIAVDNGLDETQVQNLINQVQDLQIPDIEVGAKLDSSQFESDEQAFLDRMLEIVENAKMTADEANEFFGQMGFDANFETHPETITRQVPVTITESEITSVFPLKMKSSSYQQGTQPITETIEVPSLSSDTKNSYKGIKSITKRATGSFNNYSSTNKGGKSAGGGSSKGTKYNTSNDKLDRYQEVNNQLAETNAELKKIQSQTDKLTGPDLVKNLNSQIQNLNKNLELTEKKLKIAKQEQQEYADKLKDTYGIQFNADGSINQESYATKFAAEQKKYTSAYSDNEAAKTRWEDFKELISQYNTLDTTIQGLIQDKIDNANTIIEKQIAAFRVSFDISLDLTDARQQWLEFKKEVIDELADENLLGVLKDYGEQLKTYFRSDSTGAISQDEKRLSSLVEIYKKLQAGDTTTIYGDNKQKLLEDIEEAQKQLQDDLTEWENLIDEIQDMYLKGLEQASEAFSNAIADMESITQIIDHQVKLMEYAMGSKAYKEQNKAYTDKVKAIQSQIDLQTKENIFWKNQLEITEERLKNVKDTNSEEYYKVLEEYQKAKEEYENSTNDLLASFEEQMDALTSAYVANIEAVFDEFNKGLTGSLSLDDAQSQWELLNKQSEEYLDTINSIYGIQSIANKYTESINEQSISAQQKLSKIMESELEQLRAKDKLSQYDLDRADLRYQIALKQIALEEAQQNKTTLRLRRDSQGNYSYQYTQDEDEVSKLQNELSDLYNQLYNLDTSKYNDNLQKVYDLTAEYQDKYKEILQDASLADEERQQKIFELTETYGDLINSLTEQNEDIKANLRESAMAELFDLYGKDENNYMSLTEAQKNILSQYLNDNLDLTNSAYNSIFGIYDENVERTKQMTEEQLNELMTSLVPGWTSAYQNIVDNLNSEGGFKSAMKDINDELLEASNKYFDTIRASYSEADNIALEHRSIVEDIIGDYADLVESYDTLMKNIADSQAQLETFVSAWSQAAKDSAELLRNTQETIDAMKTLELVSSAKESENTGSASNTTTSNTGDTASAGTDANAGSISNEDKAEGVAAAIWLRGSNSSGWGQGRERSRKLSEKGVSKAQSYLNSASNGSLYKKWKGKDLSPYYYGAFDTGGYTGEWNSSEGKLAILHQKELVLNAEDTKNILASVAMLRNLTNANLSQLNANSISGGNALEQNVHIEANFPNVSNSNEIEEAFNNLVNIAAQRVNR